MIVQPAPEAASLPSQSTNLVSIDSVSPVLVDTMRSADATVWMHTDITYSDGRVEPGLVLAAPVTIQGVGPYELFYLYGMADVAHHLAGPVDRGGVGIALVLALGAIAWWFSRRLVRPMQQVSRAAAGLATGDLTRRIDVHGGDDMARLAMSFNRWLTVCRTRSNSCGDCRRCNVGSWRTSPMNCAPPDHHPDGRRCRRDDTSAGRLPSPRTSELLVAEVERFDVLLNDLLEVSCFDAGEAVLEVEDVDLGVLVREWVAALQPLAAEQGVRWWWRAPPVVRCSATPAGSAGWSGISW